MLRPRVAIPRNEPPRHYDAPHILWYFGAITAAFMAAATTLSVSDSTRGTWQLIVGLLFMAAFGVAAMLLLQAGWRVPGGVLAAATVAMVPVVGLAFERLIGVTPSDLGDLFGLVQGDFQGWLFALGLATIAAGLIAFALVRFPFIFVTVTIATLLTVQTLVRAFVDDASVNDHASVAIATGAMLVLVGFVLDSVRRGADAFWWHAIGLLGMAVGLGWYALARSDDWAWITILVIAGVLILASAPFGRATWATYAVVGIYAAMANYITEGTGSWKEPALLVAVSAGLIALGIVIQLNTNVWAARFNRSGATPPLAAEPPAPVSQPPAPEPAPAPEPPPPPPPPEDPPEPETEPEPPEREPGS